MQVIGIYDRGRRLTELRNLVLNASCVKHSSITHLLLRHIMFRLNLQARGAGGAAFAAIRCFLEFQVIRHVTLGKVSKGVDVKVPDTGFTTDVVGVTFVTFADSFLRRFVDDFNFCP